MTIHHVQNPHLGPGGRGAGAGQASGERGRSVRTSGSGRVTGRNFNDGGMAHTGTDAGAEGLRGNA